MSELTYTVNEVLASIVSNQAGLRKQDKTVTITARHSTTHVTPDEGFDVLKSVVAEVDCPNQYLPGDEGKVVHNGALFAQHAETVGESGTVDTTMINSLVVSPSDAETSFSGPANGCPIPAGVTLPTSTTGDVFMALFVTGNQYDSADDHVGFGTSRCVFSGYSHRVGSTSWSFVPSSQYGDDSENGRWASFSLAAGNELILSGCYDGGVHYDTSGNTTIRVSLYRVRESA